MKRFLVTIALLCGSPALSAEVVLQRGSAIEVELAPDQVYEASLRLRSGQSAEIVVVQKGIDVLVELFGPDGKLLDSVDSPNGRQGDEPVSIFARLDGNYRLRIRALAPNEPRGRIAVRVVALRDERATRALLESRQRIRAQASSWLRSRSAPIPASGVIGAEAPLEPFDRTAAAATVVGLGEATHGSRELNDLRLSLVKRMIERHGYRLVAVEDNTSRWRAIASYVAGGPAPTASESLEWGWIGRRARRELLEWVRQWNLRHPGDRVRIVGLDPQDNVLQRDLVGRFIERAYGAQARAGLNTLLDAIAAADKQAALFGDSGTSEELRRSMLELVGRLVGDAPLLSRRLGREDTEAALTAARELAQFVDFNSGRGPLTHSRDWYMAVNLLEALDARPGTKAIFWGHNSHVSATETSWGPTGALLRSQLGCSYRAIASTFGEGGFIAQLPNDPGYRIMAFDVSPTPGETVETALAETRTGAYLAAWDCGPGVDAGPEWLQVERPLHWIGAIYATDTPLSMAYRPYRLTRAFDGIAYFPRVSAEEIPADRK